MIRSYHANISVAETGSILRLTSQTNVLNISGLHPYYTYSLSVAAVTIGPGPYGFVLNITMPEDGMGINIAQFLVFKEHTYSLSLYHCF